MIKSDFQKVLPEDSKQFSEIADRYMKLNPENGTEAFNLMKESWSLAQRWSELQASANKIVSLNGVDIMRTDFKKWCYERYRQMQLVHESTRMIWRAANELDLFLKKNNHH